jgi:hypothetical protein
LTISLWIRPRTCTHYIANDSCACEYSLKHTSMLFVRMLTIILQRMSRSIQAKEACPPAIIAASLVTSDSSVHSSRLKSQRSCQQELHQALYLLLHFRLHSISSSLFLPIRVANQRRTNQGATRGSCRSPLATMAMKGC